MKKFDYLIVGSGLFGATFAYKARQSGKTCLVIDKRPHLGGNVYCENKEGINVHKYGAFRLMRADKLQSIMNVIPQDYFLCNVAISAIAVKWNYKIGWYKITFKPRQGGVNSINMRRIFKIGWKALKDYRIINKHI